MARESVAGAVSSAEYTTCALMNAGIRVASRKGSSSVASSASRLFETNGSSR